MSQPTLLDPAQDAADIVGVQSTEPAPSVPVQPVPSAPVEPKPETAAPVAGELRDAGGNAFRPGFHRTNPDGSPFVNRKGRYMPKGGFTAAQRAARGQPATVAQPATEPATVQPASVALPITEPAAPAWTEAEQKAAATPATPVDGSPASGSAAPEQTVFDTSDDAAEVVALAVFFLIGVLFGAPEEATPPEGEQKKLVKITAALIRTTGWKGSAWWAAGLSWAAYVLRFLRKPKAAAQVQAWVGELRTKTRMAEPVPAPQPVTPSPRVTPTAAPASPVYTAPSGEFVERPGL